jgi:two-component system sensor histidine kinase KdpD
VVVSVEEELPPVFLDYILIDEVFANLIENAVKYTPPGSEIAVRAIQTNGAVRVEVEDRGPGFPPEALPRLFEPFYRVQREGQTARGTGLGLAVAKGLVEAHGGQIWAENRKTGGARLVFTLPLGEPGQAPVEAAGESE